MNTIITYLMHILEHFYRRPTTVGISTLSKRKRRVSFILSLRACDSYLIVAFSVCLFSSVSSAVLLGTWILNHIIIMFMLRVSLSAAGIRSLAALCGVPEQSSIKLESCARCADGEHPPKSERSGARYSRDTPRGWRDAAETLQT